MARILSLAVCTLVYCCLVGCSSSSSTDQPPIEETPGLDTLAAADRQAVEPIRSAGGNVEIEDKTVVAVYLEEKATDALLAHVARLPSVKRLYLTNSPITDSALRQLQPLQSLESLNLDGTQVTDAGMEHLSALKNLKTVFFRDTQVTAQGAKKLRENLPGVLVTFSQQ
jgi:Leucine-rich repeat (LRR) protein